MDIGIIGAGFAGLAAAKVLKAFGHTVTVIEKENEVGGVWARSRRYPGLTTQNVRSTYAFSDFPYPADYPEWPSGEQVQRYLASYARQFGLERHVELDTTVTAAQPVADGWQLVTRHGPTGTESTRHVDHLVVCNGIFSEPAVPDYPGAAAFRAAGGRLCHTSEYGEGDDVRGRHVLVVGYGKSSCDVAQALAGSAASVTVVVRQLVWKVPKRLMNVLNYKYLLLTRLGEALFKYIHLKGVERFLHGVGKPVRDSMLGQVQWVITRQCRLKALGLVPAMPFESIARSTVSLVTDGFFENVAAGRIRVVKEASISALSAAGGQRTATLSTGETLPADLVVCGTGWRQRVPFLGPEVTARLTDAQGNFRLYRSMLPIGVPRLSFNGYNSSFFSQLNAEVGALWLADWMSGRLALPSAAEQNRRVDERLAWMEARTEGKHAKGTNIIPFSVHHIDELLGDMDLRLGALTRFRQWLLPVDPGDFAPATTRLLARHAAAGPAPAANASTTATTRSA